MLPRFILFLLTLSFALSTQVIAAPTTQAKFISISDIHFDPFLECEKTQTCSLINKLRHSSYKEWGAIFEQEAKTVPSHIEEDTNYALLKSSLIEIQQINKKEAPKFVIVLGDFLAHNFRKKYIKYTGDKTSAGYEEFVKKTLQFLTLELRQIFPGIDIYPVVGNNDSYTGNYQAVSQGKFFLDTGDTWSLLFNNTENRTKFVREFPTGGYYQVDLPTAKNQSLIVLNSVLFSSRNHDSRVKQAAFKQLQWLHAQLENAKKRNKHVIIAYHIPLGVDVYSTSKTFFKVVLQFWHSIFEETFQNELKNYPNIVTEILAGHIHMDTFQILSVTKVDEIPVNYTSSISPIYGNNPAFKIYSYDPSTLKLINYVTYFYPLNNDSAKWQKEYSFNHIYQPDCLNCNLIQGMKRLSTNNELVQYYKKYYAVGNNVEPITTKDKWHPYYFCNIYAVQPAAYKTCVRSSVFIF